MADWKQKQVTALVNQGRYSEAAELQANELIMTDSGPRSLNGEPISAGAGQLAFKPPGLPDALKSLIPSTEVLPAATRTTALEMLQGLGRVAGVGFTLGLHMSDGPSTKWQAGGSSLSYTADDFTLRVTDSESGTRLAVPGIHNPSQYSDAQYLSYVSYKANGGLLGIHDYVSFDPPTMGSVAVGSNAKPDWLRNLDAGNAFNKERSVAYPYNEVYVNQPSGAGYFRLDSYNPQMGEIVSRKFTQFGEITEKTGIGYVNEMTVKYPAGTPIANVPTNVKTGLAGDVLVGRQILEVPVQNRPIPQAVLNAAYRADVLIRDIKGRIY